MGVISAFKRGRDAAYAQYGQELITRTPQPPQPKPPRLDPPSDDADDAFELGYYYDPKTRKVGPPLPFRGERHCVIFGLNGAGKSTRLLIPLIMRLRKKSGVFLDVKGELAFQTADARRKHSAVKIINPFNMHGMGSDGHNPLAHLDPDNELFLDRASAIGDAMIDIEEGSGAHWTESAQGLLVGVIMDEVIVAKSEKRAPSLLNVRYKLTERDEYETYTDAEGQKQRRQTKGGSALSRVSLSPMAIGRLSA